MKIHERKTREPVFGIESGAPASINQSRAMEIYEKMIEEMPITCDANGEPVYPESYADVYVNDYGNLVVCVADNEFADKFCATLPPNIEIKLVKYSLNQLNEFKNYLVNIGFSTGEFFSIGHNPVVNKIGIDIGSEETKKYYESRIAKERPEFMDAYYIRVYRHHKDIFAPYSEDDGNKRRHNRDERFTLPPDNF